MTFHYKEIGKENALASLSHHICMYPWNYSGEGTGNPLQYSCLENPRDGGAWWAAVHGIAKSRTWLSDFTFTFMHWRRKWQATPVFLPGESQERRILLGCCLWSLTESDTTEATWRWQQQHGITQKYSQKEQTPHSIEYNFTYTSVHRADFCTL